LRLPHIPRAEELDIALIGIPYDGGATYRSGPALRASACARAVGHHPSFGIPVLNLNPFEKKRIADLGDLSINPLSIEDTFQRITAQLNDVLSAGARTAWRGRRSFDPAADFAINPQTVRSGRI